MRSRVPQPARRAVRQVAERRGRRAAEVAVAHARLVPFGCAPRVAEARNPSYALRREGRERRLRAVLLVLAASGARAAPGVDARRTRRTRPPSRSPARSSRRPAARATGIRPARPPISPTTRATTSGRARSRSPPASYEYKAALNNAWDENYGLHAVPNGANIPLDPRAGGPVKFYYDHKTHWATDNKSSVIATAPGSFQSELGCPGDWDPSCLRSWLQDPDGDGTYTFETTALPAGNYETKVAINESWDENYGQGGVPGGANIPFSVAADDSKVTVQLRRGDARADGHGDRAAGLPRRLSRTSTSRARTASAPRATRRRRSGTRSRTAC